MDKFSFFEKRKKYSVNTVIKGLGRLIKNKKELSYVIRNGIVRDFKLVNNGQDIEANLSKAYEFIGGAFQSPEVNLTYPNGLTSVDLGNYILSWEDLDGSLAVNSVDNASNNFVFRNSEITKFTSESLENLNGIHNDMINISDYSLPNLKIISCRNFGGGTNLIFDCPTTVETLINASGFYDFTENSFENVTNNLTKWPFNNVQQMTTIKSLNPQLLETIDVTANRAFFFDNQQLTGSYNFPNITSLNNLFPFYRCFSIESLSFPNLTEILSSTFMASGGGQSLLYLDIRKCNNMVNHGGFSSCPSNGVIEAHIDLKDVDGSGNADPNIQTLIDKSWTVNWYNVDGTLNSTTN